MAVTASLMGRLPEPNANGLDSAALRCVEDLDETLTIVAVIAPRKVEEDLETGDRKVKFQIVHVEALEGSDKTFVHSLLGAAADRRNGRVQLPGMTDGMMAGIEDAFSGFDEETGEIQ